MKKKKLIIFVVCLLVVFLEIVLINNFLSKKSKPAVIKPPIVRPPTVRPSVVEPSIVKPSIVRIDKSNPDNMRLLVSKFDLNTGRYQEEKEYIIKGVVYDPIKIGQTPPWIDNWMTSVDDPAHRARVDQNKNGRLDENEPEIGDSQLMKDMGINTIRFYEPPGRGCSPDPGITTPEEIEAAKKILRELYSEYGIMAILGHNLGYVTDFSDPDARQELHDDVMEMVKTYKDEPWVLLWNLGNENIIQQAFTQGGFPVNYYQKTVQWIAEDIKKLDANHPISICNMGLVGIYDFAKYCHDVDIYGTNMYQSQSFAGLWNATKRINRPAYLTEFGCDVLDSRKTPRIPDEKLQADFVSSQWLDIQKNIDGRAGNALGGIIFEWVDKWWKEGGDDAWTHTYSGGWDAPTFDVGTRESGNEEWWGICAQAESGEDSPSYRYVREVYYRMQEHWKEDQ